MKPFAFVFWDIQRFFKFINDDGLAEFKALAVIVCAELLAAVAIISVVSIFFGHRFLPTSKSSQIALGGVFSLAVTILNYYALHSGSKWTRFKSEFENYPSNWRLFGDLAVVLVLLAIFCSTLIAAGAARHLPRTAPERSVSTLP
jgi:hypothetical protein